MHSGEHAFTMSRPWNISPQTAHVFSVIFRWQWLPSDCKTGIARRILIGVSVRFISIPSPQSGQKYPIVTILEKYGSLADPQAEQVDGREWPICGLSELVGISGIIVSVEG